MLSAYSAAYIIRRKGLGKGSTTGITAAMKNDINVHLNSMPGIPADSDMLCIRWGCTATVPQKKVLNKASGIHQVSDKKGFRLLLADRGLAMKTWADSSALLKDGIPQCKVVIRPAVHAQGKHCYLVDSLPSLDNTLEKITGDYYISEFIDKVEEFRVFVCSGRAVWVAKKTPADPTAVAWNVAQGGKFDNVRWNDWNLSVVDIAVKAMALTELDFGGVDVMVDKDGKCYVLEINSAPSQTSPYRQGCVAKVFDYILEHGKEHMPIGSSGQYRRYIHPALDSNAII